MLYNDTARAIRAAIVAAAVRPEHDYNAADKAAKAVLVAADNKRQTLATLRRLCMPVPKSLR